MHALIALLLVAPPVTDCGMVGPLAVEVPMGGPLSCYQARHIVIQARTRIRQGGDREARGPWQVTFRSEYEIPSGLGFLRGYTLCAERHIAVTSAHASAVLHELLHAADCEAGEWQDSRRHRGWTARGRKRLEEDFTGHKITWEEE